MSKGAVLAAFLLPPLAGAAPAHAQQADGGSQESQLAAPVRLQAGDAFIDTGKYTGYSGPLPWDIDRDGKLDLLVGSFRGHIQVFRNAGTSTEPAYEDRGLLEAEGEAIRLHNW